MILLVSDVHLSLPDQENYRLFMQFLNTKACAPKVEALYILGDFFDLWLGDEQLEYNDIFVPIVEKLYFLSQAGVKIFIMRGNRDVLMKQGVAKTIKGSFLPDVALLEYANKKIVLTHGDLLCTHDMKFIRWRKFLGHSCFLRFTYSFPIHFRKKIAIAIQKKSKSAVKQKPKKSFEIEEKSAILLCEEYQADILIHGHTHQGTVHKLPDGKLRYVLGQWSSNAVYAVINDKGEISLERISLENPAL